MQDPKSYEVLCHNKTCREERMTAYGSTPIRLKVHRRMEYAGSKKIGYLSLAARSLINPETLLETGAYHFYTCPVCGRQKAYLQKSGVMRPVAVELA